MKKDSLTFMTPFDYTSKLILDREYSKTITLPNGDIINLSSNIGNHKKQQDCLSVSQNQDYLLLLISDGMGGLQKGELASFYTAKIITEWFSSATKEELNNLNEKTLSNVLNNLISSILTKLPNGSGATLNMSIIGPKYTYVVNIGDSRLYSIKDKRITLRTKDDSLSFQKYNPTNAKQRDMLRFVRYNNIITNAISKDREITLNILTIKNEDYDVLCHMTDGVSDILSEEMIRICLLNSEPAEFLVEESVVSTPLYNPHSNAEFHEYIYPHDNATTITYTKKKNRIDII